MRGPNSRLAPSWTHRTSELRAFLAAVRRATLGQTAQITAWDAGLVTAGFCLGGIGSAAWTLRGDLARPWTLGMVALALSLLLGYRFYRARVRLRDVLGVANEVVQRSEVAPRSRWTEIRAALELEAWPAPHHSEQLRSAYIADVTRRLERDRIPPQRVLPPPKTTARVATTAALALLVALGASSSHFIAGAVLWWAGRDARPPAPPEPVWSSLRVELRDPPYTGRAPRSVANPSGPLRIVAGTTMAIEMHVPHVAAIARVLVSYDPIELHGLPTVVTHDLTHHGEGQWRGTIDLRGSGSWMVVLLDDEAQHEETRLRSPPMPLELEADRPPEIELLPLPRGQREVDERNSVDVRFHARDDFGLASAALVYQLPSGDAHRLPIPLPGGPRPTWRHRYTWDISRVPITHRSEVLYWVEVRDNDPGLGLEPLPDPPGKVTRSAARQLTIRDDESEHSDNIVQLAELRDMAVDLLAERMMTDVSVSAHAELGDEAESIPARVQAARSLLSLAQDLLSGLARAIEALAMDTLSAPRDAETLGSIHHRLMDKHRAELELHALVPENIELQGPLVEPVLRRLAHHNLTEIAQLEDEIIRLDDLVDGQIIERIEALVARLEVTQRKLVEELEALKAGDPTARARVDQLHHRRREDMRRLAEARAMLREEVEQEFMNLDAFDILDEIARDEDLRRMLDQGKVDDALEQTRNELSELQQLRDQVQRKIGEGEGSASVVSKEEQERMQLLRELSRLQDEQAALRSRTRALHEVWRSVVNREIASLQTRDGVAKTTDAVRRQLESINDARLGREARRELEDAVGALERLDRDAQRPEVSQLELSEQLRKASEALQRARSGAEATEKEGRILRRAGQQLQRADAELRGALPQPADVLPEAELEQLTEFERRQAGLDRQRQAIMEGPLGPLLPTPGHKALRRAGQAMERSSQRLRERAPDDALDNQQGAWQGIQEAIDSLRQGSPPPPPRGSGGDASTEAERDKSLREELLDAMRGGKPDGFDEPIKRYYEELLR